MTKRQRQKNQARSRGYWTKERIDDAFDTLIQKLGRTPRFSEFAREYGGAVGFVARGKSSWNNYLISRDIEPNQKKRKWSSEEIDDVIDLLIQKLGRVPTAPEVNANNSAVLAAILRGAYNSQIKKWGEYIEHRGFELKKRKLTPKEIDESFDSLARELGRIPKYKEFSDRFRYASYLIQEGLYDPRIKKWNDYLRLRGLTYKNSQKWTRKRADEAYDHLMQELDRVPSSEEFNRRFTSAMRFFYRGGYDPKIRNWSQYVAHRRPDIEQFLAGQMQEATEGYLQ